MMDKVLGCPAHRLHRVVIVGPVIGRRRRWDVVRRAGGVVSVLLGRGHESVRLWG